MEKEHYIVLVEKGLSQREIVETTGKKLSIVRKDLRNLGLKTKCPRGRYSPKMYCCQDCGETDQEKFGWKAARRKSRTLCKKCFNHQLMEKLNENKARAVALKGGKCKICGYNKYIGSLHFHHLDARKKSKNWYTIKRNWEKFKAEIEDCVLLCANCHGEVTWGGVTIDENCLH